MTDRDTSLYSLVQSILVYKLWKKPQIDREILHLDYVELYTETNNIITIFSMDITYRKNKMNYYT